MIEKLAAGAVSTGAVAVVGSVTAASSPYYELAQWMPTITGIVCAIIVWAITVMNTTKKRVWQYNALVGILTSIFTAVVVNHFDLKPMYSMMVGMTAGGMGVGVIALGKPFLLTLLNKASESLKEDQNPPSP